MNPTGWIAPDDRTAQQTAINDAYRLTMPARFQLVGSLPDPGPKVFLKDLWKHPQVVAALGHPFLGFHQFTGSCVGVGEGNVIFTLGAVEVVRLGQPEQIVVPFWPYTYGLSRMINGDYDEGEGSTGAAIAEAARGYGHLDARTPGLPTFRDGDGVELDEATELRWSNGRNIDPKWLAMGKPHIVRTTATCQNAADVKAAIKNLYPVTQAYARYVKPGSERLQGTREPVVIGQPGSSGGHQTSWLCVYEHPELGDLFWNQNQWGLKVYQRDPLTGWSDGIWQTAETVNQICADGEVFAYSQFDGFPAQTFTWDV